MDKLIYLDNAATTKTAPEVVEANASVFYGVLWKPVQCVSVCGSE